MQLDLDEQELDALGWALRSRLDELNHELTRTDQHRLQHELAQLVSRLEIVAGKVELLRARTPVPAGLGTRPG